MIMVYNELIFHEIFKVNFRGTWNIKVNSVNTDEQNAPLIHLVPRALFPGDEVDAHPIG